MLQKAGKSFKFALEYYNQVMPVTMGFCLLSLPLCLFFGIFVVLTVNLLLLLLLLESCYERGGVRHHEKMGSWMLHTF